MDVSHLIHVKCSQCGGDCERICKESGLPVQGSLSARPEAITELQARVPLLRAQRFQREQLHALVDEAERAGAWLYSTDRRPSRPVAGWDMPEPSTMKKAVDMIQAEVNCWYTPHRVRTLLASEYHPEDFYRFHWTLRYPDELIKQLERAASDLVTIIEKVKERYTQ